MVGCGIWATHFIAMLAYEPGVPVAYGVSLTALSLLAAMVITAIGFGASPQAPTDWAAPAGGAIVGAGVACMHYLGMWALEVPGHMTWSIGLVAVSIAPRHAVRHGSDGRRGSSPRHRAPPIVAATLLTLAIVSHHFTAMGAEQIVPDPARTVNEFSFSPGSLAVAIAGTTLGLLALTLRRRLCP